MSQGGHLWARYTGLLAVAGCALALSGCDVQGSIHVHAERTVSVDLVVTPDLGSNAPGPMSCEALGTPGGMTVTDGPGEGQCRVTGTVGSDDLFWLAPGTILWSGDRIVSNQPGGYLKAAVLDPDSHWDLTVTFPGPVLDADASAQVQGSVVHWSNDRDVDPVGWHAVASAEPTPASGDLALLAGCVGVLLGAGIVLLPQFRGRSGDSDPAVTGDADGAQLVDQSGSTPPGPPVEDPRRTVDLAEEDPSVWAPEAR